MAKTSVRSIIFSCDIPFGDFYSVSWTFDGRRTKVDISFELVFTVLDTALVDALDIARDWHCKKYIYVVYIGVYSPSCTRSAKNVGAADIFFGTTYRLFWILYLIIDA